MSTIQAKIAAKKLTEATGVEDKIADQMFHRGEGGHYLAVVDLAFLERTEGRDEKHVVRLEISQLEIMPEGPTADHARDLMRAVYLQRQPEGLDGTDGENPDDIIERGKAVLLTCPTCLHPRHDDTINHWQGDVDADGAYCTWRSDGTEVHPDQEDPGAMSGSATSNEGPEPFDTSEDSLAADLTTPFELPPKKRSRKTADPMPA